MRSIAATVEGSPYEKIFNRFRVAIRDHGVGMCQGTRTRAAIVERCRLHDRAPRSRARSASA